MILKNFKISFPDETYNKYIPGSSSEELVLEEEFPEILILENF
jgi:hypothetical protein